MGSMRHDYFHTSSDSKKTAEMMAHTYKDHPAGKHFAKAARHYDKALQAVDHGDDDEIVRHHDRGYNTFAKAEGMIKENDIDEAKKSKGKKASNSGSNAPNVELGDTGIVGGMAEDIEEALVAKATLERYRAKAKSKFREKGGINAMLDKQDKSDKAKKVEVRKEDVEPLDELSPKTLGSYVKKASKQNVSTAFVQGNNRGDLEGAWNRKKKLEKRTRGINKAVDKITKEDVDMHLVDLIMSHEEVEPQAYIDSIEARCNAIVEIKKDELKKSFFNFSEEK
jgi:hypothetical protein